jgi:hypothetical protein
VAQLPLSLFLDPIIYDPMARDKGFGRQLARKQPQKVAYGGNL